MNRKIAARAPIVLGAALLMGACTTLGGRRSPEPPPVVEAPAPRATVQPNRKYVVVDVDKNELRFMDGTQVLWRAPVGTGTGFRLSTRSGRQWSFHTPSGTMQVQYKELNPAWFRPDWWFIENKLPVPPQDSPLRKEAGGLGAAAVYLGDELAIHGTDKPELLGRRVSHGCIRLSNANAVRLFHNVQLGTPVMIVGQSTVLNEEQPDSVARFTRSARRVPRRPNPLDRVATPALLTRLDTQLRAPGDSAWVAVAAELVERGLKEDAPALRGLLGRAGQPENPARREEYATFLADVFSRGALRTVVSLNRISPEARQRAVEDIVNSTMSMYHGDLNDPLTPWPTRRVPPTRLGPEGQAGWAALQRAESGYRERFGVRMAAGTAR
jgi:lipoprotein-anchoring transpeptidase ErfK/SrfK